MKILHISSSYFPALQMGGPIKSVHELNKWLVKNGAEITVYTTNAGLKNNKEILFKKETEIDGVKVFYFPYYGYIHWTFSPALFFALAKNVKNFDIVHITGVWNFPVSVAAFWARFYKKPYIISPRGSLMKEPLEKKSSLKKKIHLWFFGKRDLKNASAIHFTVEREKEEYLKAELPLKKIIIIPNGLNLDDFNIRKSDFPNIDVNIRKSDFLGLNFRKKFNIYSDKKIILFLARLHPIKGLDTLIPAFAEVIKKEPKAVLVLAGPDEKNYKKEIELKIVNCKLKIDKDVIFTGMILSNDKPAAYKESNVFVLPSYSENFGMAAAEAMSFGLPVIVTKGVGISDEIEKAVAGIVIEKNEKQLSEAILKILNNPDLAKKMGEQGRELVKNEFSSGKVAERFIKEYNEILE